MQNKPEAKQAADKQPKKAVLTPFELTYAAIAFTAKLYDPLSSKI